jgi:hypothetical protein
MYMQDPSAAKEGERPALIFSPAIVLAICISAYGVLSLGLFPSKYVAIVKQSFLALQ